MFYLFAFSLYKEKNAGRPRRCGVGARKHHVHLCFVCASTCKKGEFCFDLSSESLYPKVIGCSSLRGEGGELGTIKTLTYASN